MRIVFFGTPPFAADILQHLLQHNVEVVAVVTKPDKPKGRSGTPRAPAVKQAILAADCPLPIHQPERCSTEEFAAILQQYQADLFVVVAYGEILKQNILDIPKQGCVNVHASLLPKYRGAAPIHRAIIEGESQSGVSIMYMVRKMDAGDVLAQRSIPINDEATAGELELQLRRLGADALMDVLLQMQKGQVHPVSQDENEVTFAPKIELEDTKIDWNQPAKNVHNLVRGTNPFPGAWCFMPRKGHDRRLKVLCTEVVLGVNAAPGTIVLGEEGLVVACAQDAVRLLLVKPEGSGSMTGEDLCRGALQQSKFLR